MNLVVQDINAKQELFEAILIGLLVNARASEDELKEFELEGREIDARRGYWADLLDDHQTGSKLWLLARSVCDSDTLQQAKVFALEALQWLQNTGLAEFVDIEASWKGEDLFLEIAVDGTRFSLQVPQ